MRIFLNTQNRKIYEELNQGNSSIEFTNYEGGYLMAPNGDKELNINNCVLMEYRPNTVMYSAKEIVRALIALVNESNLAYYIPNELKSQFVVDRSILGSTDPRLDGFPRESIY